MAEDEQKINEGKKPENSNENSGGGVQPKADAGDDSIDSKIERAEKTAQELKAQLDRQENLMAKQALGGKSDGPSQPEEKKPMTDKEYKDFFLKHGKPPEE